MGQDGDGCLKAGGTFSFRDKKAKEHAKSRRVLLCFRPSRLLACLEDKLSKSLCIEPAWIFSEAFQQRSNTEAVMVQGAVTASPLLPHPLKEGDEQRRTLIWFNGGGTRAAQMLQKQSRACEQVRLADRTKIHASATVLTETFDKIFSQIRDRCPFAVHPMKQMLRHPEVLSGGCGGITGTVELSGKLFKQLAVRSFAERLHSLALEKMFQHDVSSFKRRVRETSLLCGVNNPHDNFNQLNLLHYAGAQEPFLRITIVSAFFPLFSL
ncbi:MAG TPA: hypothetical protein VEO56_14710 [Bacteroidota bacterium]|nr:hypothetical protein [Bacteroidota bacterium]